MSESPALSARVARHLAWRARRITASTLDAFRRGDRTVTMTPPRGLRFGNWLYLWLAAHTETKDGRPRLVREVPGMEPWLDTFPALATLTIAPDALRFHDRRVWDEAFVGPRFGIDVTRESVDAFVRAALSPAVPPGDRDTVVVNVRRGDYYAQEHLRARYGFDQPAYIAAALDRIGSTPRIRLVSDDPQWCHENLGALFARHADEVVYDPAGAVANFLTIAGARRLIGTNSTFSYWGGYVAGTMHEDALIVMPRFHGRFDRGWDAEQLDPAWTILDGFH